MPKVSVIIPVYGVEKYIERCARSLFEQTLDDIEFIFVDDCTKDNSIAVLQGVLADYPQRQSQTRILRHDVNKGLPAARHTGIVVATGEYIAHCDSDDWVELVMYEKMYQKAKECNADMVVSDYYIASQSNKTASKGCINTDSFLEDLFFTHIPWAVWNKMVKRDIYLAHNISYPQYSMGEDMSLTLQLANFCKTISYVSMPLYYYFYNDSSITKQRTPGALMEQYRQTSENFAVLKNALIADPKNNWMKDGLLHIQFSQKSILIPLLKQKEGYKLWSKDISAKELLFSKKIPAKDKLLFLLIKTRIVPYIIKL